MTSTAKLRIKWIKDKLDEYTSDLSTQDYRQVLVEIHSDIQNRLDSEGDLARNR